MMEADVQRAFERYLFERGWDIDAPGRGQADICAQRGAELLVGEVKGTTSSPGLDVDTGYGQLLRRMSPAHEEARYALIGPVALSRSLERVDVAVRRRLGIELFVVDDLGHVHAVED